MTKKRILEASELPHHFHAYAQLHNDNMVVGWRQEWAETENELYACIESAAKDWDENPMVKEIICSEVVNGNVIRRWVLQKLQK